MREPTSQSDFLPADKAMRAATEAAQMRLLRAVEHIEAHCLEPDGVVLRKRWCKPGQQSMLVLFAWPGVLMLQNPRTGAVLKQARVSYMERAMPHEVAFLRTDPKAAVLLAVKFAPAQGATCRAVFDAWGVLTIRNFKTGEVLAKSQPGRPAVLWPGFCPLARRDLEPRIQ